MALFAICSTEDGVQIREIKDFGRWIKEYGDNFGGKPEFLTTLPRYWEEVQYGQWLLIEGEIKVPKPVQVVTEYEL